MLILRDLYQQIIIRLHIKFNSLTLKKKNADFKEYTELQLWRKSIRNIRDELRQSCKMDNIKTTQNIIFIYTKYTRANSNQIDL